MSEVQILKGLPASGKTTYARQQVEANPGQTKRWSKDDIRAMLDGGRWSRSNERFVLDLRDQVIRQALKNNTHLIIDDTNLASKHEARIRHLVSEINKLEGKQHRVRIQDFTDVPLEECIKRDLKREKSVGEKVIRDMHSQFLAPKAEVVEYNLDLPEAIVCDLDGTLALLNGRNPYDASTCDQDLFNRPVWDIVSGAARTNTQGDFGRALFLVSGRPETHREPTERFLQNHSVFYSRLYMRGSDDRRQDVDVKRDIYNEHIKGKYNVMAVFDDRLQVCRLWHSLGLPLFRVGNPDDDF